MHLFLDTADDQTLRKLMRTGVFSGVTTNPTILQRQGLEASALPAFAHDIFDMGAQELFFQASGAGASALYASAEKLAELDKRVIVKLPCTAEGLEAASSLARKGIKICITAVYAAHQALLAASVGASYVAPYLGRMNDAGRDGFGIIAQMARGLAAAHSKTQILAASIRCVDDIARLAECGAHAVTLPAKIAEEMFADPLTLAAVQAFEDDAKAIGQ